MATASTANFDLTIHDNNVFVIINHSRKQHKYDNLHKIYNELIKTIDFQNTSKEHFHDRVTELIIQEKIVNKPNRNDDSYRVNESVVHFNIEQLEYCNLPASDLSLATHTTKQSSFIESVNTQKNSINNIPETYLKKILVAKNLSEELLNQKHSMTTYLKKMKIESLKAEIIFSLESTISFLFQEELNTLKDKCEKLMQNT